MSSRHTGDDYSNLENEILQMSNVEQCSFFDRVAEKGLWHSFNTEEHLIARRFIDDLWKIDRGSRILEPGCGRGRLTELLAEAAGPTGEVVAVDISREMIAAACRRGLPANVELINESVMTVSAEGGLFDYAICCNVWPHFSEPHSVIEHIKSILCVGGHFWVAHLCRRQTINAIHKNAGDEVSSHMLPPAEDLAALMAQHDLRVVGASDMEDAYWLHAVKL
jgi:demethylmenaquinone methyltransferase/2-methoxy-6-polyprenyl-1,4-benzoquinol methylase